MIRHMRHGSSPRLMALQPIRVLDLGESLTGPISRSSYHRALEPHAVGQKDRDGNFVLAQVLQHRVLKRLRVSWARHDSLQAGRQWIAISGIFDAQQTAMEGAYPGASPFGTQPGKPSFRR